MQGLCRPTHYTGQSVQYWETGLLFFQSAPTLSGPGPSAYSASFREGFFSETAFKIALPSFYFTAVTVRRGTASVDGVQNSPGFRGTNGAPERRSRGLRRRARPARPQSPARPLLRPRRRSPTLSRRWRTRAGVCWRGRSPAGAKDLLHLRLL